MAQWINEETFGKAPICHATWESHCNEMCSHLDEHTSIQVCSHRNLLAHVNVNVNILAGI